MKKYVMLWLLVVMVLAPLQLVAENPEFSNFSNLGEMYQTKITTLEVAEYQAGFESVLFDDLAPPSMVSCDLPFLGYRYQGIIIEACLEAPAYEAYIISGEYAPTIRSYEPEYVLYKTGKNYFGGDCFGGSIPAMTIFFDGPAPNLII